MNNYYKTEEAKSLRLYAESLRACSRHNSFEFDIEEVATKFDERADYLERVKQDLVEGYYGA